MSGKYLQGRPHPWSNIFCDMNANALFVCGILVLYRQLRQFDVTGGEENISASDSAPDIGAL